jgi:hypothetical protein
LLCGHHHVLPGTLQRVHDITDGKPHSNAIGFTLGTAHSNAHVTPISGPDVITDISTQQHTDSCTHIVTHSHAIERTNCGADWRTLCVSHRRTHGCSEHRANDPAYSCAFSDSDGDSHGWAHKNTDP